MANLRGVLDADSGHSDTSRLAKQVIRAHLDTWKTFVTVTLYQSGQGTIEVMQNKELVARMEWGAER